jgi:hypothetical protein
MTTDLLKGLAATWTITKLASCERVGGPHDLTPMIDVAWRDGHRAVVQLANIDQIPTALASAINTHEGPLASVAALADAVTKDSSLSEALALRPGDLRAMREAGDMEVNDALTVSLVIATGPRRATSVVIHYAYDDEGLPVFHDFDERPWQLRAGDLVVSTLDRLGR